MNITINIYSNLVIDFVDNFTESVSQNYVNYFNSSLYDTNYSLPPLEAFQSWKQWSLNLLYAMTSLFSLVGNIVSIVVLVIGRRSSPELKRYLICLSISDILMALFSIPFTYTDFMLRRWVFPHILCPFAQFITIFSLTASVTTLTVIGIERYLAIIHPLRLSLNNKTRSKFIILGIWLLATSLASPQLFTTKTVHFKYGGKTYYKCTEVAGDVYSTNYSYILFVVTFLVPFLTLVYVYGCIGFKMFRKQIPGLNCHQNNTFINKIKAVKISAVIILLFLICWLPIELFNLVIWYDRYIIFDTFTGDAYLVLFFTCHWIYSAHSFVNPIIYSFMSANFRADFRDIIGDIVSKRRRTSDNNLNIQQNDSKRQLSYSFRTTSVETNV